MGQTISRLNEKYITGEDRSGKQESKGMLADVTIDENDGNLSSQTDQGDHLSVTPTTPMTPPNILRLKCDPRSPNFDRTPLKVPLEGDVSK